MRILIVTSAFPKDRSDSQGIIIAKLVKNLLKKGLTITVLAPHGTDIPFIHHLYGAKVFRVPYFFPFRLETLTLAPGIYFHFRNSVLAKIQLIFLLICETIAIFMICKRDKIDIIHTHWILPHGLPGIVASYFLNIPHICSIHGTDVTIAKTYPVLTQLVEFIARRCSLLTTNSRYTQSIIKSICVTVPGLARIPMGVDIPLMPFHHPEDNNQENKKQIALYVGRLIPLKGIHILIQAMKRVQHKHNDVFLYIIGDGICQERLQELVIRLKLQKTIIFLDRFSEEELINWYKKASVFILPSIMHKYQTEGLGVVLLEAMSLGIPVIGTDIGGIPDIIDNGVNGLLVPPEDPDALAEAIIHVLENPDLVERFRKAGLETVRDRFSWEVITGQFIKVYQKLLIDTHND